MRLFLYFPTFFCLVYGASDIIVTNHEICTEMAENYLKNYNVTPPELAIIISVCEGIVNPQDAGLGGGFQATVYNGYCSERIYINAREAAPANYDIHDTREYNKIGIPSVLKGYEYLYTMNLCGIRPALSWRNLFVGNIKLAEEGFPLHRRNKGFVDYISLFERAFAKMRGKARNPALANTLKIIANDGPASSLYESGGILHNAMVADLTDANSFIKSSDILRYEVEVKDTFNYSCLNYKIATTRIPGSGSTFVLGCKIVSAARPQLLNLSYQDRFLFMYHTMRYMYSLKPLLRSKSVVLNKILNNSAVIAEDILSNLDKPWKQESIKKFGHYTVPIDSPRQRRQTGTTNIVVRRGKYAITMTSTINTWYGSKLFSDRLGIFYNNQLDDFDEPNTPNRPAGNKRPQSAISATILYSRKNNPVFQIGAAGGSSIIGSIFNTFFNYFVNNMTLVEANTKARCLPRYNGTKEVVLCESNVANNIKNLFKRFNCSTDFANERGYAAVTASSTVRNHPEASFDPRRGGEVYLTRKSKYS